MTVPSLFLFPSVRHELGVVLRFVDVFTLAPVAVPLDVRAEALPIAPGMPNTPWRAVPRPTDRTYRFLVTNNVVMPVGAVPIVVSAPGGEYVDFEPVTVTLPRPFVAHPPTPDPSDFLIEHALWPTRALARPAGETVIEGVIQSTGAVSPIAALRVRLGETGGALPPTPYTYTTPTGEFVFRLPGIKSVAGGTPRSTATLQIAIELPPTYVGSVAPLTPAFPVTVPIGRVTTLFITVP